MILVMAIFFLQQQVKGYIHHAPLSCMKLNRVCARGSSSKQVDSAYSVVR